MEADLAEKDAKAAADSAHAQNQYNANAQYTRDKYDIDTTYQNNILNAEQNRDQALFEADLAEKDAKAAADSAHAQNQYNANAQYTRDMYDIDTSYQNNLLNANQQKAQAEKEAGDTKRQTEFNADQTHAQNQYAAESANSQTKYEADSAERESKLNSDLAYNESVFNAESQARSDELSANQAAEAGKFGADMSYRENILKDMEKSEESARAAEENARAAYTDLLSAANSGAYTAAQLEQLASEYGLSDAQKESLINAANEYSAKTQAAVNAELSSSAGDIEGAVASAVESGSISSEQGQNYLYNTYKDEISSGFADTAAIDKAYNNGQISEQQYQALKAQWNDSIETSADFFYSEGTMLPKSAAKKAFDELAKQPWLNQGSKNALNAIYYKLYTPITKNVTFNNDGGFLGMGSRTTGEPGNNFSVIASDGTKYRVEYGGEATDTNIKEVASDLNDGQVFGYQENLYIKQNGKIYKIQNRENSSPDQYNELYNIFFGDGDPTSVQSANAAGEAAKKQWDNL